MYNLSWVANQLGMQLQVAFLFWHTRCYKNGVGIIFIFSELLEQAILAYNGNVDDFLLVFVLEFFHCEQKIEDKNTSLMLN